MDSGLFQKDYFGQTVLNPIGLLAMLVLGLALLLLPRRQAPVAILLIACFIAPAQRISIASLNFDLLRVMVIFGVVRMILRAEFRLMRWHRIDTVFVTWSGVSAIAFILLNGTVEAAKWKGGQIYDQLGIYFLFRCLIRDFDDIQFIAKSLAIIAMPVLAAMLLEHSTGRNLFALFGGIPEFTPIRDGRMRCQGAFVHPIIAGCFWAAQVPLLASLWWARAKVWAISGTVAAIAIVALTASSTPVAGLLFGALGGMLFFLRKSLVWVRWSAVALLAVMQLFMDAPVWHLVARIDFAGGSTGWHRYNIIEQAVQHFDQWWLIGSNGAESWGIYNGDVTNQYILEGFRGGLISMLLFALLIWICFHRVGILCRSRFTCADHLALSWALGVSLFVHATSFIGIAYFGQIIVIWYMLLAAIVSMPTVSQCKHSKNRIYMTDRKMGKTLPDHREKGPEPELKTKASAPIISI